MFAVRMMVGATFAVAASVGSCLSTGSDPGIFMTVAAAMAGAILVEGGRLLNAWGGSWCVVGFETAVVVLSLMWITVEVLLLILMLILMYALLWLRRILERDE